MGSPVNDNVQEKPIAHHKDGGCAGAVMEAYASFTDAAPRRLRQAEVVADGLLMGGIKHGQKNLFTWDTAGKVALAAGGGVLFGAALVAESPLIVGGALLVGGIGIGAGAVCGWNKLTQDKNLATAMNESWRSDNPKVMSTAMSKSEKSLGPVGFDCAVTLPAGAAGGFIGSRLTAGCAALSMLGEAQLPMFMRGITNMRSGLGSAIDTFLQRSGIKLPKLGGNEAVPIPTADKPAVISEAKTAPPPETKLDPFGRILVEPSDLELTMLQTFIQEAQKLVPGVKVQRALLMPHEAWGQTAIMAKIKLPANVDREAAEDAISTMTIQLNYKHDWMLDYKLTFEALEDMNGSSLVLDKLRQ